MHSLRMLGPDDVSDCEGVAAELMARAGVDPDAPPSTWGLAEELGLVVMRRYAAKNPEGLDSHLYWPHGRGAPGEIAIRRRMTAEREAHAIGHELAHFARNTLCGHDPFEEARCDAIGAHLACSRVAFSRAVRTLGHQVTLLAERFHVEPELALLRVGEVTGRPVLLIRDGGNNIARGEPFEWGPRPLKLPRDIAHPIRVGLRMGVMAMAA